MATRQVFIFMLCLPFLVILSGCEKQKAEAPSVSFSRDVSPVLNAYCVECHKAGGSGTEASGLMLDSYESLMKGTKFGKIVTPESSLTSTLVVLIEGRADKSLKMPHGARKALDPETIRLIKNWIDQGAKKN